MLHRIVKSLLVALGMSIVGITFADTPPVNPAINEAYTQWCNAIGSAKGNASEVVKFYAPGAILLPTLSGKKLVNENNGLNAYFQKLTSLKDIKCVTDKSKIKMHGDNMATQSGFYSFHFIDHNGKAKEITARFTFVYKKIGNQWLIVNHHSSKTPED